MWRAENFRLINRPDLRLVVDGNGTLGIEQGKLALTGTVAVDEGRIEYAPVTAGTLGADVVIVGGERKSDSVTGMANLPLRLDVEVDLGRNFRFSGKAWMRGLPAASVSRRSQAVSSPRAARSPPSTEPTSHSGSGWILSAPG